MSEAGEFAAVLAAGGSGQRFYGENTPESIRDAKQEHSPKQFLPLKGLPLYAWSLRVLCKASLARIVLVVPADMQPILELEIRQAKYQYLKDLGTNTEITVVAGGKTRQASVFNALKHLAGTAAKPRFVLVHDAARPFLDNDTVLRVMKATITHGACTVGGAVSDTIKRVSQGRILETLPRESLVAVQTPQAASFDDLYRAHEEAALAQYLSTDDAALLEWAGKEVHVVDGPKYNIKITQPLDLILAESLSDYLLKDCL